MFPRVSSMLILEQHYFLGLGWQKRRLAYVQTIPASMFVWTTYLRSKKNTRWLNFERWSNHTILWQKSIENDIFHRITVIWNYFSRIPDETSIFFNTFRLVFRLPISCFFTARVCPNDAWLCHSCRSPAHLTGRRSDWMYTVQQNMSKRDVQNLTSATQSVDWYSNAKCEGHVWLEYASASTRRTLSAVLLDGGLRGHIRGIWPSTHLSEHFGEPNQSENHVNTPCKMRDQSLCSNPKTATIEFFQIWRVVKSLGQ